jgi:hypothetical protein
MLTDFHLSLNALSILALVLALLIVVLGDDIHELAGQNTVLCLADTQARLPLFVCTACLDVLVNFCAHVRETAANTRMGDARFKIRRTSLLSFWICAVKLSISAETPGQHAPMRLGNATRTATHGCSL